MWKKVERNIQLHHGPGACTSFVDKVVTDDGVTKVKTVSKSLKEKYPVLPGAENFSLEAQLKAGVKLEDVNSNLLSPELPDELPIPQKTVETSTEETE